MNLFILTYSLQLMGGASLVFDLFIKTKIIVKKEMMGHLEYGTNIFSKDDKKRLMRINFNLWFKRISAIYFLIGYLIGPFIDKPIDFILSKQTVSDYILHLLACILLATIISLIIAFISSKKIKGSHML